MSGAGENVFDLLAQKDRKSAKTEKVEPAPVSNILAPIEASQVQEGEESSWTVQSSAKTRRLVPQFTISRQDLGTDSARSKPSSSAEPVKKKVTRFTKDEMLSLRKPTKMLSCMSDMLEVVSLTVLEPVCYERLEPEDVMRIWNAERNNQNKDNLGRGRGRLLGQNQQQGQAGGVTRGDGHQQEGGGGGDGWNRNQPQQSNQQPAKKSGMWDSGASNTLDLSDFAAAAAKFRAEMAGMKLDEEGGAGAHGGEDMMERLLREQNDSLLLEGEELGGDMEDDEMPDWAADAEEQDEVEGLFAGASKSSSAAAPQQQQKRSMLLEAMHVRSEPAAAAAPTAAPKPVTAAAAFGGLDHLLSSTPALVPAAAAPSPARPQPAAPPAAPVVQVVDPEWFYTDPQGQVQGPFSQDNMHLWHEAGYFSKELPIRQRGWMAFHPFFLVFPDMKHAFALNVTEPPMIGFGMPMMPHHHQQEQMIIFERRRIEQAQYVEQQRQAQLLKEQQAREQALREAQLREQAIREANERAALEAQRQAHIKQQQEELTGQKQMFLNTMNRATKSQPPPLVAREPTGAAAAMSLGQPQQTAAAPVPLDSLKKIRISNIADMKNESGPAATAAPAAQQQQQPSSDKKKASAGPPPLAAAAPWANSNAGNASAAPSMAAIQKAEQERAAAEQAARDEAAARNKGKTGWAATSTPAKGSASLAEIQEQEERQREKARQAAEAQQPTAAPLTMSSQLKSLLGVKPSGQLNSPQVVSPIRANWVQNGPTAVESNSAVSLRDIMQQEERHTDGIASGGASGSGKQRQATSWATKAGVGVNATNLLPMPNTAAQQQTKPVAAPAAAAPSAAVAPTHKQQAAPKSAAENFGGKGMSREMGEWCRGQLLKLRGDDDLTLAEFCMTLESASDIRAYFSEVLGSNVQVANFASDFIKFKEGGRKAVDLSAGAQSSGSSVNKPSANNNSSNGFVNANKKKQQPTSKSPTPK